MPTEARNDFESRQYTSSDAVSLIEAVNPGWTPAKPDPPPASQPLVAGGLKDSHDTTLKLQLVLRASDALEDGPGRYPILDPQNLDAVDESESHLHGRVRVRRQSLPRCA